MTELRVSETLAQAFPRLRIAVVVARGFDGREPWPAADAELAALEHAATAGLDATDGDIVVGFAGGHEEFSPLGEPDTTEHPRPGEVIYQDGTSVLTRHWNHRDAERTKVTPHSTHIAFLLETTESAAFGPSLAAAAAGLAARIAQRSPHVTTRHLMPASPATVLPTSTPPPRPQPR